MDSVTQLSFSAAPLVGRAAPAVASGTEQGALGQGQWEVPQWPWARRVRGPLQPPWGLGLAERVEVGRGPRGLGRLSPPRQVSAGTLREPGAEAEAAP